MSIKLSWQRSALIIFTSTLLLLCIVLAVFAIREVGREKIVRENEIKKGFQNAADLIATEITSTLGELELKINLRIQALPSSSSSDEQTKLLAQIQNEENLIAESFLISDKNGISFPLYKPLYLLSDKSPPSSSPFELENNPLYKQAVTLENVNEDYAEAILAYENIIVAANKREKAALLNAISRCFLKAKNPKEAVRIYEKLTHNYSEVTNQDGIPYGFIARFQTGKILSELGNFETSSLELFNLLDDLFKPRWELTKPQFDLYSDKTKQLIQAIQNSSDEQLDRNALDQKWAEFLLVEKEKTQQMNRIELLVQSSISKIQNISSDQQTESNGFQRFSEILDNKPYLFAFKSINPDSLFAFLYDTDYFINQMFPNILAQVSEFDNGLAVVQDHLGRFLASQDKQLDNELQPIVSIPIGTNQEFLPWTISVYEKIPGFSERQYKRKRNLYLLTAAAVISILFFGGFLAIRSTAKELKLARMQSEFVSTVSHEFRTPLMSIRYLGELLQRGRVKDEEKRQEYYDTITEESKRLGRLIENTLDFSKIEAGMKKYSFEQTDIIEVLDEAGDHFQKQFLEDKFILEKNIGESISSIYVDKEALTRALLNLLDNAAKYSGDSRKIILRSYEKENFTCLEVEDFGIGIPDNEQKKVFEKFYRSENIQEGPIKGSGIGLTLVAHTVHAHLGEVLLESKEGKGTKITLKLPIHFIKDKHG